MSELGWIGRAEEALRQRDESDRLCAELQAKLESALATIRLLESTPAMDAIAATRQSSTEGETKP